jgi:hypothetical protein
MCVIAVQWAGLILSTIAVLSLGYVLSARPDAEGDKEDLVNSGWDKLMAACGRLRKKIPIGGKGNDGRMPDTSYGGASDEEDKRSDAEKAEAGQAPALEAPDRGPSQSHTMLAGVSKGATIS